MDRLLGSLVAVWALILTGPSGALHGQTPLEITFATSDGVVIHGDWYVVEEDTDRPLILLFHQGGADARGEYTPIVPRLLEAGYDLLAIDQRRGGDRFGSANRTVEALGSEEFSYCDAEPDLDAALTHARERRPGVRPVLWGSSYSAALALKLAFQRGEEVSGVLAFSPASGEPMTGCDPGEFAADVWAPALVLRPVDEATIPRVAGQLQQFSDLGFRTFVANPGTHGSSMLVPERAGGDVSATWEVVLRFLDDITNPSFP